MGAKAIFGYNTAGTARFGSVLARSVIVLAALEILTGVIAGASLITDEKQSCGGAGNLYVLRCTTSNPHVLLGAAVIMGTLAQGFLLMMAGLYINRRGNEADPE